MPEANLVTIASDALTARINPLGAELWSLAGADGREYMTDADPAFWTGHAPLLFPVIGELNGKLFRLNGREYPMPRHGFARHSLFELVEHGPSLARFALRDSGSTLAVYPFAFELEMLFRLDGATLAMRATVENPGSEPLPFSFGFHPAFAWPLPGGGDKLAHTIAFEQEEPEAIRRLDAAGLLAGSEPTPVRGRTLPLAPELFEADAVVWDRIASRSLTYAGPGGATLEIAFPDTPELGLWQKPGAAFLCIEPWAGHADPVGFTGDLPDKPGIVTLAPGEAHSLRMDVTVRPG
ncbi:MAG: aldose 1-epimerase family protein [Novosphingobium sp.]